MIEMNNLSDWNALSPEIGSYVECAVCGRQKCPRSSTLPNMISMCGPKVPGVPGGCDGYDMKPRVGDLWPGEIKS